MPGSNITFRSCASPHGYGTTSISTWISSLPASRLRTKPSAEHCCPGCQATRSTKSSYHRHLTRNSAPELAHRLKPAERLNGLRPRLPLPPVWTPARHDERGPPPPRTENVQRARAVSIHRICHRKIHSVLTERELFQSFHTWESLQTQPDIANFVTWVAKKPPGFYSGSASTNAKRRR